MSAYRSPEIRFVDPGLHLMALDAATDGDAVPPAIAAIVRGIGARDTLPDFIAATVRALHAVPIDVDAARAVVALSSEYASALYELIEIESQQRVRWTEAQQCAEQGRDPYTTQDWTKAYRVSSLEGLAQLPALEHLEWDATPDSIIDLTHLAEHPSLVTVHLSGRCTNVRALETLPRLRRVFGCSHARVDDPTIVDRLRARVQFL